MTKPFLLDECGKVISNISLLQIDSDDKIAFGDTGTAHFFINKDDLKNRNFDKVWMYWDCC